MKGQTLIETVLAVSIIGIIIGGISVLMVTSLSNSGYVKNQALATQYGQEGLEVVRSIRNASYSLTTGTYCLGKDVKVLNSSTVCTTPNVDSFIRTVAITAGATNPCDNVGPTYDVARVIIEVKWRDAKCASGIYCHKSSLESCLSTQNPVTAP